MLYPKNFAQCFEVRLVGFNELGFQGFEFLPTIGKNVNTVESYVILIFCDYILLVIAIIIRDNRNGLIDFGCNVQESFECQPGGNNINTIMNRQFTLVPVHICFLKYEFIGVSLHTSTALRQRIRRSVW